VPETIETTTYAADIEQIAGNYLAVWSEPDPERRRDAISALWARDGVEFVEGAQFRGLQELCARITEAYQAFVESGRYTVTSADDVSGHHDIITFTIQLATGAGEVAWAARIFLVLGEDGRVLQDYQLTVKPLAAE
jgi:hypothetical protein